MKKILLVLAGTLLCMGSVFAISPSYKGYGELYSGYAIPSGEYYDAGFTYGLSTSHGVTLMDGVFVGVGIDAAIAYYTEGQSNRYGVKETDYSGLFAAFAEGRYNILRTKRISPFVGLRIGGGFNGYDEVGGFYFSPAVGCTFNITKKFGLDASIGYSLLTGDNGKDEGYSYNDYAGNINCITFRVGVHF